MATGYRFVDLQHMEPIFKILSAASCGSGILWWRRPAINDPDILVYDLHLSSKSDVYKNDHEYTGIILYSHKYETEWTLNGIHCKTGYIVVLDSNSYKVTSLMSSMPGPVDSSVYKCVFGEEALDIVADSFDYSDGEFVWNSWFLRMGPYYQEQMNKREQVKKCIKHVLKEWVRSGETESCLPEFRTFGPYSFPSSCRE